VLLLNILRLYDEDILDADDPLGEVFLKASELDMEAGTCVYDSNARAEPPVGHSSRSSRRQSIMMIPFMGKEDESRDDLDVKEEMERQESNGLVVDRWYDVQPSAEMVKVARKTGNPFPDDLGKIRLRTCLRNTETREFKKRPATPNTAPPLGNFLPAVKNQFFSDDKSGPEKAGAEDPALWNYGTSSQSLAFSDDDSEL